MLKYVRHHVPWENVHEERATCSEFFAKTRGPRGWRFGSIRPSAKGATIAYMSETASPLCKAAS